MLKQCKCGNTATTAIDLVLFVKDKRSLQGVSSLCKECAKEKSKTFRKNNPTYYIDSKKEYHIKNREHILKYKDDYRKKNPTYMQEWQRNNKDKTTRASAYRRALKLQATPKWLTPTDYIKIQFLYSIASFISTRVGVQMHVDHIIPLQGRNVCGFHCPSNLQVITAKENLRKSNSFNGGVL